MVRLRDPDDLVADVDSHGLVDAVVDAGCGEPLVEVGEGLLVDEPLVDVGIAA